MARAKDEYANIAEVEVEDLTGDGTTYFTELLTGISLGQGTGIIIDMIEYRLGNAGIQAMDDDADYIAMGWSVSDSVSGIIGAGKKQIVHVMEYHLTENGTPADAHFHLMPFKFDFLPPIILAAPRLYGMIQSNVGAVSAKAYMRMYFRYIELSSKEYLELAETFVLVG